MQDSQLLNVNKASEQNNNVIKAPKVNNDVIKAVRDAPQTQVPRYYFYWSDPVLRLFGVYSMMQPPPLRFNPNTSRNRAEYVYPN